jgi:hypothetical protein
VALVGVSLGSVPGWIDGVRRCASGLDRYGHTRHAHGLMLSQAERVRRAARSRGDTAAAGGVYGTGPDSVKPDLSPAGDLQGKGIIDRRDV